MREVAKSKQDVGNGAHRRSTPINCVECCEVAEHLVREAKRRMGYELGNARINAVSTYYWRMDMSKPFDMGLFLAGVLSSSHAYPGDAICYRQKPYKMKLQSTARKKRLGPGRESMWLGSRTSNEAPQPSDKVLLYATGGPATQTTNILRL